MENRQAFIGIFLIIIVTLLMPYFMRWMGGGQPYVPGDLISDSTRAALAQQQADSAAAAKRQAPPPVQREQKPAPEEIRQERETPVVAGVTGDTYREKTIRIENSVVKASLSNLGGGQLTHWELKQHEYYGGGNVNLVHLNTEAPDFGKNGLDVELVDRDGDLIEMNNYRFMTDLADGADIVLDEDNPKVTLSFYLPVKGGRVIKDYTFYHDRYDVELVIRFENLQSFMGNRWYSIGWENGLEATEENKSDDYDYARAYVSLGGELEKLDVSEDEHERLEKTGHIDWTAVRTKYFLAAIIPHTQEDMSVALNGTAVGQEDYIAKVFNTSLGVGFPTGQAQTHADSFTVYLGPISISDLEPYGVGLENLVMNRDWYEEIFRPISRWMILPAFTTLHKFIPNYGLVIIIFSILVKLLLHPLTKKSYESMSKMQVLGPKMTELREKYANDSTRLNHEMMKMYKEQGVNPLGGCLPMLLQMPLLFALFIVFRSTIQLRGEPFIGWITDLSRPDQLPLGFELPYIGESLAVLPLLMGVTMVWQSKMTITDPKQKMMSYFMPVFLIFIFYNLPSGLNMYYAIFNLLSMIQTRMIKKKMEMGEPEKASGATDKKSAKPDGAKAKKKGQKALSVKEQLAKRRAGMSQGNRAQRRQSKK